MNLYTFWCDVYANKDSCIEFERLEVANGLAPVWCQDICNHMVMKAGRRVSEIFSMVMDIIRSPSNNARAIESCKTPSIATGRMA